METEPQPNPIAQLNDAFRRSTREVILTAGVQASPDVLGLIAAVRRFDRFTPDNDSYGEHDFGSIMWESEKTFWKIDYYNQKLEYGEDPLSPECRRVLTVMLAEEY